MHRKTISSLLTSLLVLLAQELPAAVRPERYGAFADGIHDDAPAFNSCIRTGRKIKLKAGSVYVLHSRLDAIESMRFRLQGNGATIVIAGDYPVREYDEIFTFSEPQKERKLFSVENLVIKCQLGQKFPEQIRKGDTYIMSVGNCRKAVVKNVDFEDAGEYNNVSFLVNTGANLEMSGCSIKSHSKSLQGGALWVMDIYREKLHVGLKQVKIDYDTRDESFCLARARACKLDSIVLSADVRECFFSGPGEVQSSGFFIEHTHNDELKTSFDVSFTSCQFVSEGQYPHRIIMYQTGMQPSNIFKTTYSGCTFRFHPSIHSEVGLVSMVPSKYGLPEKSVSTIFNSCVFDLMNVCSIIGDKDGETSGSCIFNNCQVTTDENLFARKYNPGAGRIDVRTFGGRMSFKRGVVSTENFEADGTDFDNGTTSGPQMRKER